MHPEFILPKISPDNDRAGVSRRIFFVSTLEEFKDFDYGEKTYDKTHIMWSKI